jgi:hypothetical protein
LIDQIDGELNTQILKSLDFEALCTRTLSIIYLATKNLDNVDKDIACLIDTCFDMIIPCIVANPDKLIPIMYSYKDLSSFIICSLKFKGDEGVRKTVSHSFKLICNHFDVNSKFSKVKLIYYIV